MSDEVIIDVSGVRDMGVRVDDYCGLWAIEPLRFQQMLYGIGRIDLRRHVEVNVEAQTKTADVQAVDGFERIPDAASGRDIAVIEIQGTLTKRGSSLGAGSSVVARSQVRRAANDAGIAGILIRIDSPGGTVAGTADLAGEVSRAASMKPVHAFIEDLGASAAYWVASQATKVYANNSTAIVGSIGTFMGLYDVSGLAEKEGIKAVVIKAGEFKGAGFPGTQVTDEQVAKWQASVNEMQSHFTAGITKGRGFTAEHAASLVTGETWLAEQAVTLKLIDGVQSLEATLQGLQQSAREANTTKAKGKVSMSETTNNGPVAATFSDIVAACHGIDITADASFITGCLSKGLTANQSAAEWNKQLKAERDKAVSEAEAKQKELDELKASTEKSKSSGVPTVGTREGGSKSISDPLVAWNAAIAEKIKGGMSKQQAAAAVAREQPELRQALIAASN